MLTVSHDRYFLDKAVDHLLIFENGRITERQQVYSDYLESKAEQKQPSAQPAKVREKKPSEKLSYKEKKELESLELNMPKLEQEIAGLEEQLNSVTDYKEIQDIGDLLQNKRDELEEKETRWMELSEKVE